MTNENIIFLNSLNLMEAGIMKGTGKKLTVVINDEEKEFEEPEPIHTFAGWKELGYKVKKGEHSNIKFAVWAVSKKKADSDDQQNQQDGQQTVTANVKMYMKNAAWFTFAQVEPIAANA